MYSTASSWEIATPASLCKQYYQLVCEAKKDNYTVRGKIFKRTQQQALDIELIVKNILSKYAKQFNSLCGKLVPIKVRYADSIGVKKDIVAGYWVAKEYNTYIDKNLYPVFGFFNDGNFTNSQVKIHDQQCSWKKITEKTYQITTSYYRNFNKKWEESSSAIFTIDFNSSTATYSFNFSNGKSGSSTWYYKGKAYDSSLTNEREILETIPLKFNLKKLKP